MISDSSSPMSQEERDMEIIYLWLGGVMEIVLFWIQTLSFLAQVSHRLA